MRREKYQIEEGERGLRIEIKRKVEIDCERINGESKMEMGKKTMRGKREVKKEWGERVALTSWSDPAAGMESKAARPDLMDENGTP